MVTLTAARRLCDESSGRVRVLVIDSDAAIRSAIMAALEWDSCDVLLAGNADEAIELAHRACPDVIVVGAAAMGAANGPPFTEALGHVPLVACYDRSTSPSAPRADAVVRLPLDTLELLAIVRLLAPRREGRSNG